ncbi:MAG TPA: hypothetical protein VK524_00600, partial [Polyangiaceae bacterium]|nr:hypothetical protein [Polyangiaceae bacterium]
METCATHGLRYNPELHDGCPLCRRLATGPTAVGAAVQPHVRPRWNNQVIAAAGIIMFGALLYSVWSSPLLSGGASMGSGWDNSCARRCASQVERCAASCGTRAVTSPCYTTCAGVLNDCLPKCGDVIIAPGKISLVYSSGNAPPWLELAQPLSRAMVEASKCGRRTFSARLSVLPDGKIARAGAGTPDSAAAECIELQFLQADIQLPKGEYSLAVRGVPSPQQPRRSKAREAAPLPEQAAKPKAIDYLAQLDKLGARNATVAPQPAQPTDPTAAAAPNDTTAITPVPPLSPSWKPRVLPVDKVAAEIAGGRGHLVAVIEYDAGCAPCMSFLDELSMTAVQLGDLVEFHFYALMLDSDHDDFVQFARLYKGMFEPVRITSPHPELPLFSEQLAQLGVRRYKVAPQFTLFNAAGRPVLHGADLAHVDAVQKALARLAREPYMTPLSDLPPPEDPP